MFSGYTIINTTNSPVYTDSGILYPNPRPTTPQLPVLNTSKALAVRTNKSLLVRNRNGIVTASYYIVPTVLYYTNEQMFNDVERKDVISMDNLGHWKSRLNYDLCREVNAETLPYHISDITGFALPKVIYEEQEVVSVVPDYNNVLFTLYPYFSVQPFVEYNDLGSAIIWHRSKNQLNYVNF